MKVFFKRNIIGEELEMINGISEVLKGDQKDVLFYLQKIETQLTPRV